MIGQTISLKKNVSYPVFISILLFLVCCSRNNDSPLSENHLPLNEIKFWAYQIQGVSDNGAVDQLANSHYDLLVLEPTRTDWSSDDKFFDTREMVERLKNSLANDGTHRKLVIAYIDIGQAAMSRAAVAVISG